MTRLAVALAFLLSACVLDEATEAELAEGELESESTTSGPTVTELANYETVTISGGVNSIRYFKLEVPAGRDHVVVSRLNTALMIGADIYMKRGGLPTPASYQCRAMNGVSRTCNINYPTAGAYYIMVQGTGSSGYANLPLKVYAHTTYTTIPNGYSETYWNQYGVDRFYKIAVPANVGKLTVTYALDPNDDGKVDLVVKSGAFATGTSYDCKKVINWDQWSIEGTCTFTNPAANTWYIGLLGHGTKVVGTLKVKYTLALINDAPTTATRG
jgi:hypothetical protein